MHNLNYPNSKFIKVKFLYYFATIKSIQQNHGPLPISPKTEELILTPNTTKLHQHAKIAFGFTIEYFNKKIH